MKRGVVKLEIHSPERTARGKARAGRLPPRLLPPTKRKQDSEIVKRKAPVPLTGGAGFRYENPMAARFLIDLLAGTNSLGADFGKIKRIDWQARDSGWLADDLVVSCKHPEGDRCAGISIKSDQQVTRNGFPAEFVEIAWRQWLAAGTERKLHEGRDAVVLITGSLTDEIEGAWSTLLREALETTAERMVARLSAPDGDEGSQSSRVQRALFESFHCPEGLRGHGSADTITTMRVLRHVRLLHFDYEDVTSRDDGHAIADCQHILRLGGAADAERLWRRLVAIADEKRPLGASIELPQLLAKLRGEFDLRDHPDYQKDWELLERYSQASMADVRTDIAGLAPLPRVADRASIQRGLDARGACFLVGESGCGKSALAKEMARAQYRRVVWVTENTLDYDTSVQFEQGIGICHPLVEVLSALPGPCLVVFDSIDKYPARALRLVSRLIQDVLGVPGARHTHFLFTAQFEAADRTIRQLVELRVPLSSLEAIAIAKPSETDVQGLVAAMPQLQWASLRPELRPLLTNLKVLDWVVAAVRSGQAIDARAVVGLTTLIDALWERWVEDGGHLGRSHLLMRLATLEAATLSAGVPRLQLEHSEQPALQALAASDLVRIRDERARFSHDLVGDWARMRVLVGEDPLSSPATRERAALPRWHRAVRLYGQRLLEQSADGCERWRRALAQMGDGSDTDRLLRDLFLESVFLAANAAELLERTWTALTVNGGRLLNRLLNRFLFVATLPDPRISVIMEGETDLAQWEHLLRLPYWPYWGPMLTALRAHSADVAQLAPHAAARICSLWLRTMPTEVAPGWPMPWRREAAELSLAIGREIQARNAEGNWFSDGLDKAAYEAVLWAAPELPNDVAALCLELAERRDVSPEIRVRVDAAHQRRREERDRYLAENPHRERASPPIPFLHGRRRAPWRDGPREAVDRSFRDTCLDTGAFVGLVRADPDAALEVLLAVCIEDPQYEFDGRSPLGDCGLEHWSEGDPPLWCRGPFLQFLRQAPEQGLSFVLRLTNFATLRYTDGHDGLTIVVNGQSRNWRGDNRVFRWHHDWPLHNGSIVQCALMALERWLYEQIDQGVPIEPWVTRIVAESASLAFAGLLFDVGKRHPPLFAGVLRPLLFRSHLCDWDFQATSLRRTEGMGYWGSQPVRIIQLAQEWYRLPHRFQMLAAIGGPVMQTMIGEEEFRPFFAQLRAVWASELDSEGEPQRIRLLIERFNPNNYAFESRDGKQVPIDFQWPEDIARQNAESLRALSEETTVTNLPFRCRQWLDFRRAACRGTPPSPMAVSAHHRYQSARTYVVLWGAAPPP